MSNELKITEGDSYLAVVTAAGASAFITATTTGVVVFDSPTVADTPAFLAVGSDDIRFDITAAAAAFAVTPTFQPRVGMQIVLTDGARVETWPNIRTGDRNTFTVAWCERYT